MPGTGKTKFAASCPNILFLATEPGQQFTTAPVVPIGSWVDFQAAIVGIGQQRDKIRAKQLDLSACPYTAFCVDIIDNLYGHCRDYVCQAKGLDYPPQNDFGKTWQEITREWTKWLASLMQLGNVIFISHSSTVPMETKTESGADASVDVHVPSFSGNKAAQYLDGILNAMGFLSVDASGNHVITFKKTSTIGAKDRTDILATLGSMETNWQTVAESYKKQASKMGLEVRSKKRGRK
jgi:hypothetical protein